MKTKAAFRVEPILGRVPRFTSRKPVEKLTDTRTGFKKKNTLRENAAAALEGVESGRWTASNLHNSVNALYATFQTGCGATAKRPFDAVQTDAVSSLKAWIELEWPEAFREHAVHDGPPPGQPPGSSWIHSAFHGVRPADGVCMSYKLFICSFLR